MDQGFDMSEQSDVMEIRSMAEQTKLSPGEAYYRQERNIRYLLELKEENLLFPYYREAGLTGSINRRTSERHGGWDAPDSHIRGTFTAHWLSAAAWITSETPNPQLKAKMDFIVSEIRKCQVAAGGQWAFPIPQSFLHDLTQGKDHWAPLYVCHKVLMGLFDVYRLSGSSTAMEIIKGCSEWFFAYSAEISREQMTGMMDRQETGGLMEIWADLYEATKDTRYRTLLPLYERETLYSGLLDGKDVLSNMHANSTIPEIHGAARAYEVTGDIRYRRVVENYWDWAVTKRGMFCTGGQTLGEVWAPPGRQSSRLGEQNQEHCVVYNMIRLADYLYRWTGDAGYSDYIERNIVNGIYAQGFWEGRHMDMLCDPAEEDIGIVTYYLPLHAGAQKKWGSKTDHFWCCHCTAVQANSRLREFIFYKISDGFLISQYLPSILETSHSGRPVKISLSETDTGGSCNRINDLSSGILSRPDYDSYDILVSSADPAAFTLKLRIPWWVDGDAQCLLNGTPADSAAAGSYIEISRTWTEDKITIRFPKKIQAWPLSDEPDTVAFLDGPVVLAGLVDREVMVFGDIKHPEDFIKPHNERLWSFWTKEFKITGQPSGFYLKPLYQIGREKYTVYFPVINAKPYDRQQPLSINRQEKADAFYKSSRESEN
ncbi:MAG: beta-L-arabinofuranosidase domain-containing protein [Saccharofermentanales bacterium]